MADDDPRRADQKPENPDEKDTVLTKQVFRASMNLMDGNYIGTDHMIAFCRYLAAGPEYAEMIYNEMINHQKAQSKNKTLEEMENVAKEATDQFRGYLPPLSKENEAAAW